MANGGPTTSPAAPGGGSGFSGLSGFGTILSIAGAFTGAIGSFYSARASQLAARSAALNAEFEASIAALNAKAAEQDAQLALLAGQRERGRLTQQHGRIREGTRARQAAAGIETGVGSAAEVQASNELAKAIDSLTIDANAAREAGRLRIAATDLENRAALARVSAQNIRTTAGSISPGLAAATSLLGAAPTVASQWVHPEQRRIRSGAS